jgi:hypothetical protein
MGQCHEIFCFRFFHESPSPKPLKIALGSFQIFSKQFAEIFASQGAPPVSTTLVAILPLVDTSRKIASIVDKGGKFATSIIDNGGKFCHGKFAAGVKLPPVSTTPMANNGNNIRLPTL